MTALQDVVPSAVPNSEELVPQVTSTIPDGLDAIPLTVTDETGMGHDVNAGERIRRIGPGWKTTSSQYRAVPDGAVAVMSIRLDPSASGTAEVHEAVPDAVPDCAVIALCQVTADTSGEAVPPRVTVLVWMRRRGVVKSAVAGVGLVTATAGLGSGAGLGA